MDRGESSPYCKLYIIYYAYVRGDSQRTGLELFQDMQGWAKANEANLNLNSIGHKKS